MQEINRADFTKPDRDFYSGDVLEVAPGLLGKYLVLQNESGKRESFQITETEAYRGIEDKACHASKGRTARTEIMFSEGGHIYIYLIYGIHWMLNIVSGSINNPQAVLIRGVSGFDGPGKLTKRLNIDKSYYGIDIMDSDRIWIEDRNVNLDVSATPRIGIDYAGSPWKDKKWRFVANL